MLDDFVGQKNTRMESNRWTGIIYLLPKYHLVEGHPGTTHKMGFYKYAQRTLCSNIILWGLCPREKWSKFGEKRSHITRTIPHKIHKVSGIQRYIVDLSETLRTKGIFVFWRSAKIEWFVFCESHWKKEKLELP